MIQTVRVWMGVIRQAELDDRLFGCLGDEQLSDEHASLIVEGLLGRGRRKVIA